MKTLRNKSVTLKVLLIILFSSIYAIGLQIFIQPAHLLTTGLAGVVQVMEFYIKVPYGLTYFLINLPGVYIGFRYVGRRFTIYSLISIITVSLLTSFVGVRAISDEPMLNSIFGGILMGFGIGSLLKIGASSGGTDFFGIFLQKQKNIEFSKVNLILNVVIIVAGTIANTEGGIAHSLEIMLYTLISLYARNVLIDNVFTNNHTTTLFIVGDNLDRVSNYIKNKLNRGTTILKNVEGGYSHSRKEMIMTTLNKYEYSVFIDFIDQLDESVFVTVLESNIVGNYKLDKGEVDEPK